MSSLGNEFQKLLIKASYPYSVTRSAAFLLQSLTLPLVQFTATGKTKLLEPDFQEHLKQLLPELNKLLKQDAENISKGLYPLEVLAPTESPLSALSQFRRVVEDTYGLSKRRENKKTKEFNPEAQQWTADLPDYYTRNFHFQTDGYLSEKSAHLYEHQVEILFGGSANPMRRLMIPEVHHYLQRNDLVEKHPQGEGLHFLELGAGTGSLTRFMKLAFPKIKITVLDLSEPYLQLAKKNLKNFSKLNFFQGDAANLSFQDESFDGVYSCFLFHELPLAVRKQVLREAHRVLKTNGFYGMVDSLQMGDNVKFDWALKKFPVDFHEPFFKNYAETPLDDLIKKAKFKKIQTQQGFFSKAITAEKSES